MPQRLFPEERQKKILQFLDQRGRVSVNELSDGFGLSQATIRADLEALAEQGLLLRTHGGAISATRSELEQSFDVRRRLRVEQKERIGAAAAELVGDGEAIVLDASTTSLAIAARLKNRRELTIITPSLAIANELMDAYGVNVLMPGGFLRRDSYALVGIERAHTVLEEYNLQKGFFGAKGFSIDKGLTDVNQLEVATKRELARHTQQVIAVLDGSKWGQVSFVSFAATEQIQTIVTDDSAPAHMIAALRERGITVLVH